jgi:bifunctional non-homologous end joining protein LigD
VPTRTSTPKKQTTAKKAAAATPANLATYVAKRNFDVTSEPAPGRGKVPGRGSQPSFMVHKHDATRMHYDLRLEMDGALASWAIPKGPSFNPRDRRLAVQTEDHPLEYSTFEGRIPDGEYGAGDSLIWDRGHYDTIPPGRGSAQRKQGHIQFVLDGEKLKGRWHLLRTRGGTGTKSQWLVWKGKDEHASEHYDVVEERPESVVSGRRVTRGPTRAPSVAATSTAAPVKAKAQVKAQVKVKAGARAGTNDKATLPSALAPPASGRRRARSR